MLQRLADAGLVKGKTVGIEATTLEANAALRSIEWIKKLNVKRKSLHACVGADNTNERKRNRTMSTISIVSKHYAGNDFFADWREQARKAHGRRPLEKVPNRIR